MQMAKASKLAADIGFAIGVLNGLSDFYELPESARETAKAAAKKLEEIDIPALFKQPEEEKGKDNG